MQRATILTAGLLTLWLVAGARAQEALEQAEAQAREPLSAGAVRAATAVKRETGSPGYLGVVADDSGPGDGVRLVEVKAGGPADSAGLQRGDLVTAVAGQAMHSIEDFAAQLGSMPAGARVAFQVLRGDQKLSVSVVLGQRQGATPAAPQLRLATEDNTPTAGRPAPLGVRVQALGDEARRDLGVPIDRGALITKVSKGSAADKAGLTADSVIVGVDGREINSPDELADFLSRVKSGQSLKVILYERGTRLERVVKVEPLASAAAPSLPATSPAIAVAPRATPAAPPGGPALSPDDVVEKSSKRMEALERRVEDLERQLEKLQRSSQRLVDDLKGKPGDK